MATHSSMLAWRIPWTEETGRLESIGLQRVGHDWSDWAHRHITSVYISISQLTPLPFCSLGAHAFILYVYVRIRMYTAHPAYRGSSTNDELYHLILYHLIAQLVKNRLQCRRPWDSWVRKIPWRRERLPTPVFLDFPGGSDGKESTWNAGNLVRFLGWEDPLKEGMATHFRILVWRIPRTEEPGGCSPWGYKDGLDWGSKHSTALFWVCIT